MKMDGLSDNASSTTQGSLLEQNQMGQINHHLVQFGPGNHLSYCPLAAGFHVFFFSNYNKRIFQGSFGLVPGEFIKVPMVFKD